MASSSMAEVLYRSLPHVRVNERAAQPRVPVRTSAHFGVALARLEMATARALPAGAR